MKLQSEAMACCIAELKTYNRGCFQDELQRTHHIITPSSAVARRSFFKRHDALMVFLHSTHN
jgi:hypothetical protein